MGRTNKDGNRLSSLIRIVLLLVGLSTYLVSPDDIVWRFIKTAPHARLLEHLSFGFAAFLLGIALLLKIRAGANTDRHKAHDLPLRGGNLANLLQAIGIGFLLPLPGFFLLVFGEAGIILLLSKRPPVREQFVTASELHQNRGNSRAANWKGAVITHLGLCCALTSMIIFSIVLVDRVADVLFTMTAAISTAASLRGGKRAECDRSSE